MNVLGTGFSGFIGSSIVDKLKEAGHEVRIFDTIAPHRSDVEFYNGNILDISALMDAMKDVDIVFHLAAVSNVDIAKLNPLATVRINSEGTVNVLEAARRTNVKRVIYASTIWVYENCNDNPCTEESLLGPPNHIYTSTKLQGEFYCKNYKEMYGVPFTILRYGIPYGIRARSGTVIPIFVNKALKGLPLTIQGTGEQFRNFINVTDLAAGNVASMAEIGKNKIYNLEGNEKVSVKQVAENIKAILNAKIEYVPARTADFVGKTISNEKARKELGWTPKIKFKDGVADYIRWFKG